MQGHFDPAKVAIFVILFTLVSSDISAQTSSDIADEIQQIQELTNAAQEAMGKDDLPESKRLLTACIPLVHTLKDHEQSPDVSQVLNRYQETHNKAWKGAKPLSDEELEAFTAKLKKKSYAISQIRKNFNSTPESWPQGSHQSRRFIANMLSQQKSATEFFHSLAKDTPPPLLLMQQKEGYEGLYNSLFKPGYDVATAPSLASKFAKEKLVPETKSTLETLLKAAKESTNAEQVRSRTWEIHAALNILENIDLALQAGGTTLDGISAYVGQTREALKAQVEHASSLFDQQIDSNRMPNEIWQNGPRTSMIGPIKRAYKMVNRQHEVLRITLLSHRPDKIWETFRSNEELVARYSMYVKAAIAVKLKSGEHRVFFAWYKRSRLNAQGWSGWSYSDHLGSFLILPENISK